MGEENKRVEASLTRGLEALHQLEAKLVFHETPLPSLEEPSVECPVSVTLSEHLASLVSQNKDLEETMREILGGQHAQPNHFCRTVLTC